MIAGCGGGGGAATSALPSRGGTPANSNSTQTTTASVKIQISARATKAARRRPNWISPSSTTLGIRVLASPLPDPTPTEDVVAIPTPGPVPTSITVQLTVPVSTDTFVASVYDANHNTLATGSSSPTPITLGVAPTVDVTMLGVAAGVQYTVPGASPTTWRVLENMGAAQTTAIDAQPVDADDNPISGALASPAPLSASGGVTLSPSSITGDTSITATYPSNTAGSASITSPLALNTATSPLNAAVTADYYVFVNNNDGSVQVIDALTHSAVGAALTNLTTATQIAALSGCSSGAFAIAGYGTSAFVYSVATPTTANPTPAPSAVPLSSTILSANPFAGGAAADTQCDGFYNNSTSSGPVVALHGFDSTIAANASFASGFNEANPLKTVGGQLYTPVETSAFSIQAQFVSESTGGAATATATYSPPNPYTTTIVGGSGTSVYVVSNLCSGQPVLQSLSGGSLITLSQFDSIAGTNEATDGTIYLAGQSVATGNPAILSYGPLATIGTAPMVNLGGSPIDVAVTPDQQYVCVLEAASTSSGQIEFYRRLPVPSLVATVPLSNSVTPSSFSIGP